MKSKAGNIHRSTRACHRSMHGLDDIASDRKRTQRLLKARLQDPLSGRNLLRQTKSLQFDRPTSQELLQPGVHPFTSRSQVGQTTSLVRDGEQRPIETGPAFGIDLPFDRRPKLCLVPWPKFQGDSFRGARMKSTADIIATDDKILAVIRPAPNQHMNMSMRRVPVVNCDPVEPGAKIPFSIRHQLSR